MHYKDVQLKFREQSINAEHGAYDSSHSPAQLPLHEMYLNVWPYVIQQHRIHDIVEQDYVQFMSRRKSVHLVNQQALCPSER